ncbi:serine protease [Vibrio sp. Of7-15]|uniref:S1 family peptidase n=1 Tax=Vibrio sp. Of7-15 TaxID=2724879 RepID=UPI001EF22599|nr:serine protease [Vibrio sp. Of7-15]MCG7495323.1 serine protease [Vibrio sp. Of7-15]
MIRFNLLILFIFFSISPTYSATLPDTIDKIRHSVVGVGTYNKLSSPRATLLGTGFAIHNGRYVATNAHVVPKELKKSQKEKLVIFIRENNKVATYVANLVTRDDTHDLAILKLENKKLPPFSISGKTVREGELYAFTGFPIGAILGLYPVTHRGIISSITPIAIPARNVKELTTAQLKRLKKPYFIYQLDATAYPGNSGSPVYDPATGQVIAVINKTFVKQSKEAVLTDPSAITYAIPVQYLNDLLKKALN